jgi:hypothetical protein
MAMAQLRAVCPVSDEDTNALPVKDLGPAIAFYEAATLDIPLCFLIV